MVKHMAVSMKTKIMQVLGNKIQGSRFKVQDSRLKTSGLRHSKWAMAAGFAE